jgi:hypothetical protein
MEFKLGGDDDANYTASSSSGSDEEDMAAVDAEADDVFQQDKKLLNGTLAATDVEEKKNALKDYGKESRHNVISRKDNLILVGNTISLLICGLSYKFDSVPRRLLIFNLDRAKLDS